MTQTSKTIIFFGNERLATGVTTDAPTLRALIESGYDIAAVVVNQDKVKSRKTLELEVSTIANDNNIPILSPVKPTDIIDELKSFNAPVAILAAYGKIVPQNVIDIFPKGIINIHPSLLPLHRGPTPIESVILSGAPKTGVSIMQLVKAMDAGPVFAQAEIKLDGQESKQELADRLGQAGSKMIKELLPGILAGDVNAVPQNESKATYDNLITKSSGIINWSKPALQLEREIRAYLNWPKSRTDIAGKEVIICEAHAVKQTDSFNKKPGEIIIDRKNKSIHAITSDGLLCIDILKPVGKQAMSVGQFLVGYVS